MQVFRDLWMKGFRDSGIKGFRDLGILRDFEGSSWILRDSKEILVFLGIFRDSGIKGLRDFKGC